MIREAHAPDALALAWVQGDNWRTTRSQRTAVAVGGGGSAYRRGVAWRQGAGPIDRRGRLQATTRMTPEEFRTFGYQLTDWIAAYRATVAERPVMSRVAPGEIKAKLPTAAPQSAERFEAILQDFEQIILPGLHAWQHPSFFAYFPSNSLLASVLGDDLATGIGALGLAWQSSPALTALEEVVTDWVRRMLGLSDQWSGVIQDTASTSTLVALLCARERATDHGASRDGLQAEAQPLTIYCSSQAHSSATKAALLAGFGRANIRHVPHDETFALAPAALRRMLEDDAAAGLQPCAIVATTGTTATTALDPITEVAEIARHYRLWLHVDAAMAGAAMILPECRWMWTGIEHADSVVCNAHTWLGVTFDCSLYYVRDPEHLVRVMSTNPSYLRTAADDQVKNYRDWGIQLGHRFRALKLWFLLREQGIEGLQKRLRRDLNDAHCLANTIRQTPRWQLLAPVPLQTLCVRHQPDDLSGEALDRHTLAWAETINRSGQAYLTPAVLEGRWMVRISLGAAPTEREDVMKLWALMGQVAENRGEKEA
jgi:aromatic-L-amino-acid/L-tryptophan decarboxylase